jgi:tetratricopeptide (TPR) repeat protein
VELAERVRNQWEREAGLRQLFQPVPLRVRWSSTGKPVAASRDVVLNEPEIDWEELPLRGDASKIATAFQGLPHRQLVVIGAAGAGKSVLAMLLTLSLLNDREPGDPVPVLLPISSWDPAEEEVPDFVARRLGEEYPDLAKSAGDGLSLAGLLVARALVLPVLDGMDELPQSLHPQAVEELDRWTSPGRSVVVTCRTAEYARAVGAGGSVISRAAVIEIEPVTPEDAIEFLSHPAPSRPRWQQVFDHLRASPHSPLARTLSTPLMVALARTAYRTPTTSPAGLLVLDNGPAVAASLIEGFISGIYGADPSRARALRRRSRKYRADYAARWLSCLSYHLYLAGTSDLWWWQLTPGFMSAQPGRVRYGYTAACILAVAGCVLAVGLPFNLCAAVWAAVTAALALGAGAAGWFRFMWPAGYPLQLPRHYRLSRQRRVRDACLRWCFGVMFGLLTGLAIAAPLVGLAGAAACGLMAVAMPAMPAPAGRQRQAGPRTTIRSNWRSVLTAAVQYGLPCGAIFSVIAELIAGPRELMVAGCAAVLAYGIAAASSAGLWTWIWFRAAHLDLAAHRQLPVQLWNFLDDAHHRGALRQAGTAWQFRHALLQDHLARTTHQYRLRTLADTGDQDAADRLADLLTTQGRVDEAIIILRPRANAGDWDAARRLAGLLARHGRAEEAITLWRPLADAGDLDAADRLADLLARQGRVEEAITVWRPRADDGDRTATGRLAELLARYGRAEEAIAVLRARADTGDLYAVDRLADLLTAQGRVEEAITLWRPHADAGDQDATRRLAGLLNAQGRVEEAVTLWRDRADAGDQYAAGQLADLLATHRRMEELRALTDAGDLYAMDRLAELLTLQGQADEAVALWRRRADAGDRYAAGRLADLLTTQGRVGDAIAVLRPRADAGDPSAVGRLADLLTRQGQIDQAIAVLRRLGSDADGWNPAGRLAELLVAHGRPEEAIAVLRPRADAGDHDATRRLAELLTRRGRAEEAITLLRRRVDAGDQNAAEHLAHLLTTQSRVKEAITLLRPRADAGDRDATGRLAELLTGQGRADEAITLLRAHVDAGDRDATGRLAELLARHGRVDEAITLLRAPADAGYRDATRRLAELLTAQGRLEEAITLLRAPADAGDHYAMGRLADLLARLGLAEELRARADAGDMFAAYRLADLLARLGLAEELRARADAGDMFATRRLMELLDQARLAELRRCLGPLGRGLPVWAQRHAGRAVLLQLDTKDLVELNSVAVEAQLRTSHVEPPDAGGAHADLLNRFLPVRVQVGAPGSERLGVMLAQVLLVADLETVVVHLADEPARALELAVGKDVTVDEPFPVDRRAGVVRAGDAVVEHPAADLQLAVEEREVAGNVGLADVLGDADRADRVEVSFLDIAVVRVPDLREVLEAGPLDRLLGPERLLLRQRDAERLDPVLAGRVHDHAAPAAANVKEPHARLQVKLARDEVELVLLRLFERGVLGRVDGAGVRHRRAEHPLVEAVGDVIVVGDRACVALLRVHGTDGEPPPRDRNLLRRRGHPGEQHLRPAEVPQ